jgi:hypothetical protein
MKTKLLSLFLITLLIGCSAEEANDLEDIQNLEQSNLQILDEGNYQMPDPYVIQVEYLKKEVNVHDIPAIRASFIGVMYGDCSIPTMSILQNLDPYKDTWLISFPPVWCSPGEDTEDLNTTITNDPRVNMITDEG